MEPWEQDVQRLFRRVERLLQDVETVLKTNGLDTPVEQPNLNEIGRIKFPRGYIRKVSDFLERYSLVDIVGNEDLSRNIAYALQLSDVFNYFMNRFDIDFSAGKLLRKYAHINIVSIIESLLYGSLIQLRKHCIYLDGTVCQMNRDCTFYLKSPKKLKFRDVMSELGEKNILSLENEERDFLLEVKGHRDNVHVWTLEDNEYKSDYYGLPTYNRAILLLKTISTQLARNGHEFQRERFVSCKRGAPW